jgi:hypothetical protein
MGSDRAFRPGIPVGVAEIRLLDAGLSRVRYLQSDNSKKRLEAADR